MLRKILLSSLFVLLATPSFAQNRPLPVVITNTVAGSGGGGSGDVNGPASATDNANVCFDGTTGKLIKECSASFAPNTIHVLVTTNDSLANQTNLGGLSSGLLISTVIAGSSSISIASAQSCSNQFFRSLTASFVVTCAAVGSADITDGAIVNADINASAAIAYSKLSLTGGIVNADINASAAIAYSKLALTGLILNADLAGSIASSKLVGTDIATVGTITTGTWSATAIAANKGGTGQTTYTKGDLLASPGSNLLNKLSVGTDGQVLTADAASNNGVKWSTVSGTGDVVGPGSATDNDLTCFDGTTGKLIKDCGISADDLFTITGTPAQGDMFYTDGVNILLLNKSTSADRLVCNTGSSNNPAWCQADLTKAVTGVLPVANGGTNIASYSQGDIPYASGSTTISKLAKDTNATRVLCNTGTSNNPAWCQVPLASGVTGVLPVANSQHFWLYGPGVVQAGTASVGYGLPTNPAVATADTNTNVHYATADFADGADLNINGAVYLTTGFSAVDLDGWSFNAGTSTNNFVMTLTCRCWTPGSALTDSYAASATVTQAGLGTANALNHWSSTGITLSCSAGDWLFWNLQRTASSGSDTLAQTVKLLGASLTVR